MFYVLGGFAVSITSAIMYVYIMAIILNITDKRQAGTVIAFLLAITGFGRLTGVFIAGLIPEEVFGPIVKMLVLLILCGCGTLAKIFPLYKVDPKAVEIKIED